MKKWLNKHLNWTVILGFVVSFVAGYIIDIILILTLSSDSGFNPFRTTQTWDLLSFISVMIMIVIPAVVGLNIAEWTLKKKHRSGWWVLILFVLVVGWVIFLCLENRSEITDSHNTEVRDG